MRRIGNTPVLDVPELQAAYDLPNLSIKDESANAITGTWKDRRSGMVFGILAERDFRQKQHVCLISAGNSALSISRMTRDLNVQVTAIMDESTQPHIVKKLEEEGVRIISADLSREIRQEEIVRKSKINGEKPLDITNDCHEAFRSIFREVEKLQPDIVVCPYGGGEALYGLSRENSRIQNKHRARIVGARPQSTSVFADKLNGQFSPYHDLLGEFEGDTNFTVEISDQEIAAAYESIHPHLKAEPSSAIAFAALRHLTHIPGLNFRPTDRVIVVNSGRGVF